MDELDTTITLAIGETFQEVWNWTADGVAVDARGMIPTMTIRSAGDVEQAVLGVSEITMGNGTITFNWPCSITTAGSYQYDLWADRRRIASGLMCIVKTPTRWS